MNAFSFSFIILLMDVLYINQLGLVELYNYTQPHCFWNWPNDASVVCGRKRGKWWRML